MAAASKQKLPLQKDIDWRLALKERPFLGFFVLLARGTMLIAIVATFLIATALLLYALYNVYDAAKLFLQTKADGKGLTFAAIEAIDLFLLVTVLHIVAIGLYQLYIQDEIPVPKWVKVETIDDLKTTLSGVVILALAVFYLGRAIAGGASQDLMLMGVGTGAVVLSLTFFVFVQHYKKQNGK